MAEYLFHNPAYPIVYEDIDLVAPLLKRGDVRGVAFRDREVKELVEVFQQNVVADNRPDIASRYKVNLDEAKRETSAGRKRYEYDFTDEIVLRESTEAGILIAPDAVELVTAAANRRRHLFTHVYNQYAGNPGQEIYGHTLFTPKGGDGRAPMIHVDFLPLTGHWAFALSPVDIMVEEPDQYMWDALNRRKQEKLGKEDRDAVDEWLTRVTAKKQEDFLYSKIGDLLFFKGQRYLDLSFPENQAQVCVHKSSNLIPQMGQATAIFYPVIPKGM